jgi:hypothetical protein
MATQSCERLVLGGGVTEELELSDELLEFASLDELELTTELLELLTVPEAL